MRTRWLLLGYVHTQLPISREERRAVEKRANAIAGRRKFFVFKLATVSVILLGGFVGCGPIAAVWLWRQQGFHPIFALIVGVMTAAFGVVAYSMLVWRWYTLPMRQALNELGYNVCVRCGYWLRDLDPDTPSCPECGAPRREHVRYEE